MRQNLARAIDSMRTVHARYIQGGAPVDELLNSCKAVFDAADAPPIPNGAPWTPDRIDQLKSWWQKGISAQEIADILGGVTRNAVIGKAHRLGLEARPNPAKGSAE